MGRSDSEGLSLTAPSLYKPPKRSNHVRLISLLNECLIAWLRRFELHQLIRLTMQFAYRVWKCTTKLSSSCNWFLQKLFRCGRWRNVKIGRSRKGWKIYSTPKHFLRVLQVCHTEQWPSGDVSPSPGDPIPAISPEWNFRAQIPISATISTIWFCIKEGKCHLSLPELLRFLCHSLSVWSMQGQRLIYVRAIKS